MEDSNPPPLGPKASHNHIMRFKEQSLLPNLRVKNPTTRNPRSGRVVFAAQSNFFKVIQTIWKVGKDGIEAGTNLVPESVPRSIARISVTVAVLAISLFVLKSFLSTAFFVLAMMGLVYFTFIALNKDQGPKGGGGTTSEDPLEEARRIMEKYKKELGYGDLLHVSMMQVSSRKEIAEENAEG
ncbi:unnamed protein product [Dovyalis caffra]|uniref:Uncharacterized protein n=1 Tax=Dovyalis caffra TaxID=77055 RepID=A0AAV1SDV0_9ROSI|nr:unnamed protein product [Dovyalis caffra]